MTLTLEPWFIEPCTVHHQLLCRIGLNPDDYKLWTLDRNPTRGPITRASQAIIHRHLLPNRVDCPEGNCPLPLATSP